MELLKKLKKMLRRYRGLIAISSIILCTSLILSALYILQTESPVKKKLVEEVIDVSGKAKVHLTLKTKYLCGMETEIKEFPSIQAMENWLNKLEEDWTISKQEEHRFEVKREVYDDLSPLCKNEGYFGLSEDGKLTLFQGPPGENQVIETFFRIDTSLLESNLPVDEIGTLKKGIRVHNVSEYFSILSTYGEFATE